MLWAALAVVGIAVVAIVIGLLMSNDKPSIQFPDSIAGRQRMSSSAFQGFAEVVAKEASVGPVRPQVAFYGTGVQPSFMVLAYSDAPTAAEFRTFWADLARGFSESGQGSVDLASIVRDVRGSTTYECAPFTIANVTGSLCVWNDGKTLGLVETFDPTLPTGLVLTPQIREAVAE